jgi:hypothetical protein
VEISGHHGFRARNTGRGKASHRGHRGGLGWWTKFYREHRVARASSRRNEEDRPREDIARQDGARHQTLKL